jgi:coniferyl-aldehyde dehydrogenase
MAQSAQHRPLGPVDPALERIFQLQRAAYLRHPYPSLEERAEHLRLLDRVLVDNRRAIAEAIDADSSAVGPSRSR